MPNKSEELEVTNAKDWRKSQEAGQLVELPSGKVARLTRPHLFSLVKEGLIPDPLSGQVMEMLNDTKPAATVVKTIGADNLILIMDITCKTAFVEPRVVDEPKDNELSPNDLDFDDKVFVFWWCQGGIDDLKSFRKQQSRVMETVHERDQVQPKAKQSAGRKR